MDWLGAFNNNENDAMRSLYKEYRSECISWLKNQYNLDSNSSTEVFQLSVVILFNNIRTNKLTELTSSIKTYLFAIAKNKALEYRRKQQHTVLEDDASRFSATTLIDEVGGKVEMEAQYQLIDNAFKKLGSPCKDILIAFHFERKSMEEITLAFNYKNAATTKNLKYKCFKRLQKLVLSHQSSNYIR